MVNDVRFLQYPKAAVLIDVIFDVIFTLFKLKHCWNAQLSIEITPDGIVTDVNDEHPENA